MCHKLKVGFLWDAVLKKHLGMAAPDVTFGHTQLIDSDPDEAEAQATLVHPRTLSSFGVRNGSQLECEDFLQKLQFRLTVQHRDSKGPDVEFRVSGELKPPSSSDDDEKDADAKGDGDDDDLDVIDVVVPSHEPSSGGGSATAKRPREAEGEDADGEGVTLVGGADDDDDDIVLVDEDDSGEAEASSAKRAKHHAPTE